MWQWLVVMGEGDIVAEVGDGSTPCQQYLDPFLTPLEVSVTTGGNPRYGSSLLELDTESVVDRHGSLMIRSIGVVP
jgi:hypothetical protein